MPETQIPHNMFEFTITDPRKLPKGLEELQTKVIDGGQLPEGGIPPLDLLIKGIREKTGC